MFCAKCGKEIREGAAFCSNCGAAVTWKAAAKVPEISATPKAPAAMSEQAVPNKSAAGEDKDVSKPKSKKTGLLIAGIVFAAVVVVAGILLFFYFRNGNEEDTSRRERRTHGEEERNDREADDSGASGDSDTLEDPAGDEADEGTASDAEYREASMQDIIATLDAYQEYIDQSEFGKLWGEGYYGCDLIYLDNDEIPEVVICGEYEAAGNIILTYDGNQVHGQYLSRLNFSYMERRNLLCNSDGHMGYYYDVVYSVTDGELTPIAEGSYNEVYDEQGNPVMDEYGDIEFEYFWDGRKVSPEEYRQALNEAYPAEQYPVRSPYYSAYSDMDVAYPSVYDAYYKGINKLTHLLAWADNPLTAFDSADSAELCRVFMLFSLFYDSDIEETYPYAYTQDWWLYMSEEDVRDYLLHSIGRNDITLMIQYANTDANNLQAYVNYIDGMFVMTAPDTGDYMVEDPLITEVKLLSDAELQVSGTIKSYAAGDPNTTFFTVRVTPDRESVWSYQLFSVDRWDTYLVPFVDSQLLTEEEVRYWSPDQLRVARNEIYARHGRMFDDEALQRYFESRNWYNGTISAADFDDSVLNEYEIANRDFIVQYESSMGYR